MKGIVLAGGTGGRLHPITYGVNKHLLPVFDKPMIYYSLSVLMMAGLRDILVVCGPDDLVLEEQLLKDGSQWGINISYAIQLEPKGLAQALSLGEGFIGNDSVCLVLGDNVLHGSNLTACLEKAKKELNGATVFAYYVDDPKAYGVLEFNKQGKVTDIFEKPDKPPSNYAAIGLYFYDNNAIEIAKNLKPSVRGELEITDLNRVYLQQNKLHVELLDQGYIWFDAGTPKTLLEASQYVSILSRTQGLRVMCPGEIAWRRGYIDDEALQRLAAPMLQTEYGRYLARLPELDVYHKS
ncbi:MAG: glucose-1-phosphate thymidylyltransferase RfbA [Gammaproteobacteria bacterium]|nr:glucose-1-phosphate thymidylyltransferase RfbA [Gammaproteobacteria bacterium]